MVKRLDGTIRHQPLDQLDLRYADLRLPSPPAVARLRQAVEQEGMRNPVLVSDGVAQGKLVVIDGFKRVRVARELGHNLIAVRIVALGAVAAQVAILQANPPQRGLSHFEEGLIVHRLHREHGLSQVEIAELLGRHKTWVCRRLSLVEGLESAVQEDLRLGLIFAAVARDLALLPRGTQAAAARTIAAHRLSSRQTAQLVKVLRLADPAQRTDILDRPLDHLPEGRSQERYPHDPRLGEPGNRLRQYLLRMKAASHRMIEAFGNHPPDRWRQAEAEILAEIVKQVLPAAREALAGAEQLVASIRGREHAAAQGTPAGAGV